MKAKSKTKKTTRSTTAKRSAKKPLKKQSKKVRSKALSKTSRSTASRGAGSRRSKSARKTNPNHRSEAQVLASEVKSAGLSPTTQQPNVEGALTFH